MYGMEVCRIPLPLREKGKKEGLMAIPKIISGDTTE
jgi:hypothetical protein